MSHLQITFTVFVAKNPKSPGVISTQDYNRVLVDSAKAMKSGKKVVTSDPLRAWAAVAWCQENGYGFKLESTPNGNFHSVIPISPTTDKDQACD